MSIIHGSWIVNAGQDYFFVWGQAWRSLVNETFSLNKSGDFVHPFNLDKSALLDLFHSHEVDVEDLLSQGKWHTQLVGMPTIITGTADKKKVQPVFAGNAVKGEANLDLYLWEVRGFRLSVEQTLDLLQILSLQQQLLFHYQKLSFQDFQHHPKSYSLKFLHQSSGNLSAYAESNPEFQVLQYSNNLS